MSSARERVLSQCVNHRLFWTEIFQLKILFSYSSKSVRYPDINCITDFYSFYQPGISTRVGSYTRGQSSKSSIILSIVTKLPGVGEGYTSEFLEGVCRPVPQILTQFQTKVFHCPHQCFKTWPLKSIPVFRPLLCHNLASHQQRSQELVKFSSNDILWILLFLYFSFGEEKTDTFIRSRGSLENHTRFKTILVKVYTSFQTKMAQKPYPLGRHIPAYIAYIGAYPTEPPPPPPWHSY